MSREFDRNMFIMLLSIMIGVIIITYFIADVMRQSQIGELKEEYTKEIEDIEKENVNFTGRFIDALVLLNLADDFRMDGEINFQTAYTFYKIILKENNESRFNDYKKYILDYCTEAKSDLWNSYLDFNKSIGKFIESMQYTTYEIYNKLGDLYINFSRSGARLTWFRYNMTTHLINLTNLLAFENNTVGFSQNISDLMNQFNETLSAYLLEEGIFSEIKEDIELYDLYKPLR